MTGGGPDPDEFNIMMCHVMEDIVDYWEKIGEGLTLSLKIDNKGKTEDITFEHILWADNIILLADTAEKLENMAQMVTDKLYSIGFKWKPKSLEVLTGGSIIKEKVKIKVCISGQ